MGHKNHCFVLERVLDAVLEDVLGSMVVDGREGVVKKHDIATKVGTAGQVEALTLTTREVDPAQTSLLQDVGRCWLTILIYIV